MSRPASAAVLTLLLSLAGSGVAGGQAPAACGAEPGTAQPFAPVLADSGRLFRLSLSADGRTMYYFKKVTPGQEDYRIYVSRLLGDQWTPGERLDLGGEYSDLYPSLSRDGGRLVFASYRPAPGDTASPPNAYLWYVGRRAAGWGVPVFMAAAARFGSYHAGPVIGPDSTVAFHRTSPDWRVTTGEAVRWDGVRYVAAAVPEDPGERWRDWRPGEYHVWGGQRAPSGEFAVLDVSEVNPETKRRGPPDVWVTEWRDGDWSEPRRAGGGINSAGSENFVTFHPNGCELLFTRDYSAFYRVAIGSALGLPQPR